MFVYINGKFFPEKKAKVSVFDSAYLYGDSIFETLRSYNGYVFKCDEHIRRLFQSAKSVSLEIEISPVFLKSAIYSTLKKNRLKDAYIRLTMSRGVIESDISLYKKPTIVIITREFKRYSEEFYKKGVSIITTNTRKTTSSLLPYIKSGNFLWGVIAKASSQNYFEVVFLNNSGYLTEGAVSNIFVVKGDNILTPPLSCGILDGITRKTVFEIAKSVGIPSYEKLLTLDDLYCADEVFLTNTLIEIMPVVEVDGRVINYGSPGKITKELISRFRKLVCS